MNKNLNDWIGYNKNKNYQRSISSKPKLHNNSIELVNTIKKHNCLIRIPKPFRKIECDACKGYAFKM